MSIQEVENVFKSVVSKYGSQGIKISGYGYCEHHRHDNCPDKKPSTRLMEEMVKKHNIDTTSSYVVGIWTMIFLQE